METTRGQSIGMIGAALAGATAAIRAARAAP